jgi:hypothetical protein
MASVNKQELSVILIRVVVRGTPEQVENFAEDAVTTLSEDNADARVCYSAEKNIKTQADDKDARNFENHLECLEDEDFDEDDDDDDDDL